MQQNLDIHLVYIISERTSYINISGMKRIKEPPSDSSAVSSNANAIIQPSDQPDQSRSHRCHLRVTPTLSRSLGRPDGWTTAITRSWMWQRPQTEVQHPVINANIIFPHQYVRSFTTSLLLISLTNRIKSMTCVNMLRIAVSKYKVFI